MYAIRSYYVLDDVIVQDAGERFTERDVDTGTHGALVQVGLAVGSERGQTHHRHRRVAPVDDDADVGHALITHFGENRIEMHAILYQCLVGIPAQAVLPAHDIGQVMSDFGLGDKQPVRPAETVALAFAATGDDQDAIAAASYNFV